MIPMSIVSSSLTLVLRRRSVQKLTYTLMASAFGFSANGERGIILHPDLRCASSVESVE